MKPAATTRPNIGIYANEDEALQGLVARLVSALDPQAIWLFGSRARGDHRPDSDFDLLVVARPGQTWGDDYCQAYMATSETGLGCDVVPCAAEDFIISQLLPTTLVSQVLARGCKLFEAQADWCVPGNRTEGFAGGEGAVAQQSGTRGVQRSTSGRKAAQSSA